MPIIRILETTTTKVPYPKKKGNNKGDPTHRAKEKHQIGKMSSNLNVDDLMKIQQNYDILSYMGMILVPYHLCDADDPLMG